VHDAQCTNIKPKEGKKYHTTAFRVSCSEEYSNCFTMKHHGLMDVNCVTGISVQTVLKWSITAWWMWTVWLVFQFILFYNKASWPDGCELCDWYFSSNCFTMKHHSVMDVNCVIGISVQTVPVSQSHCEPAMEAPEPMRPKKVSCMEDFVIMSTCEQRADIVPNTSQPIPIETQSEIWCKQLFLPVLDCLIGELRRR